VPRILFTTQVFYPSHDAISQILEELSVGLAKMGCEVHVLTPAANYMTREELVRHELHEGVRIWRLPALRSDKGNLFRRSLSYGAFLGLSGPALALIPLPDVAFYLSMPPALGWSASPLRRLSGARTVFVAEDVYPEILERSGKVTSGSLLGALGRFERSVLRGMDRVVVLGERMREVMEGKGVSREKIAVIENWSIGGGVGDAAREGNPLLSRLGLADRFVVEYSGNMGVVHDMAPIADAARRLKGDPRVAFLLIGDGKRRAEMEASKSAERLDNMTLLPYQPREELSTSLAAADVALISLRPEMEGLVVPSKLYGILASGRPVLNIGDPDGEVARIIDRAGCGVTVRSGEELARAISRLADDGGARAAMGERARVYSEAHCGRGRALQKYRDLIEELTGR